MLGQSIIVDDKYYIVARIIDIDLERLENIVGKGENAGYQ